MEAAVRYLQSAGDSVPSHGGQISWLIGCILHTHTHSSELLLQTYFLVLILYLGQSILSKFRQVVCLLDVVLSPSLSILKHQRETTMCFKVARTCLFLLAATLQDQQHFPHRGLMLFPSVTFGNPAVIKGCIITQCKETSEPRKLCPCKSPLRETGESLSLCLSFPSFCQSCLSHSVLSSLTCQLVHVCRGFLHSQL